MKQLLNFDLEDSDEEPDLLTVANSQHDGDEDVDPMVVDPETPVRPNDETEVDTRDGNTSDKERTADEETDDEGTGQYWKLKLKDGPRQKVAVAY